MLSAKPWKSDAILRLVLSVFVCVSAGSLLVSGDRITSAAGAQDKAVAILRAGGRRARPVCAATLFLIRKPWRVGAFHAPVCHAARVCVYRGLSLGAWAQHFAGDRRVSSLHLADARGRAELSGRGLDSDRALPARARRCSWAEAFGFEQPLAAAVLLGVLAALIFLPLGWGLQQASALNS